MTMSQNHSNRQWHNWLVYDIGDHFLAKYSPNYKGTLYDLGAGESPYKDFFLQHADQYIAVDWAGSFHDTKADIAADLNKPLPIDSEVADTVVSLSVLEHLCEPQTMLNEAFRILKPGGGMVLQVPWQWWIHEAPFDFFRYTPYGLKYLFEKAGFVDVTVEPQSGFFTMWILKGNYFSQRFIRGPRPLRALVKAALLPFWYLGQKLAPLLDKLDKNWALETSGYYVTAKKP
ncbi:methyltransferase domain-containing protein [Marinobacter persicus]|uniref:Methyltransferase family protein n=1 Tax=Marinobacter persicus TaxID=930118 RepID=A0A2S6G683_9GAMM|nr:methyltransferase domain-containing protein [Marinobacter persicus]PPK51363.1 methyltransferase family protein [Marinobacter persicus]PPK54616.1 methyltransferase family protein [Marinobacter persicus]PPK58042.1 methyltransferase family protein [Marinobacter persicus]